MLAAHHIPTGSGPGLSQGFFRVLFPAGRGQNHSMETKPTVPFILTLLAGLWSIATGGMMYQMGPGFPGGPGTMMWGHGVMWGMGSMMRGFAPGGGAGFVPWLGLAAGAVLLIGSIILYTRPDQCRTWGLVIVVVSAVNLFLGMGGLLAGTLGVVGGALAMGWTPGTPTEI